jgi:hypothetical protein
MNSKQRRKQRRQPKPKPWYEQGLKEFNAVGLEGHRRAVDRTTLIQMGDYHVGHPHEALMPLLSDDEERRMLRNQMLDRFRAAGINLHPVSPDLASEAEIRGSIEARPPEGITSPEVMEAYRSLAEWPRLEARLIERGLLKIKATTPDTPVEQPAKRDLSHIHDLD